MLTVFLFLLLLVDIGTSQEVGSLFFLQQLRSVKQLEESFSNTSLILLVLVYCNFYYHISCLQSIRMAFEERLLDSRNKADIKTNKSRRHLASENFENQKRLSNDTDTLDVPLVQVISFAVQTQPYDCWSFFIQIQMYLEEIFMKLSHYNKVAILNMHRNDDLLSARVTIAVAAHQTDLMEAMRNFSTSHEMEKFGILVIEDIQPSHCYHLPTSTSLPTTAGLTQPRKVCCITAIALGTAFFLESLLVCCYVIYRSEKAKKQRKEKEKGTEKVDLKLVTEKDRLLKENGELRRKLNSKQTELPFLTVDHGKSYIETRSNYGDEEEYNHYNTVPASLSKQFWEKKANSIAGSESAHTRHHRLLMLQHQLHKKWEKCHYFSNVRYCYHMYFRKLGHKISWYFYALTGDERRKLFSRYTVLLLLLLLLL